MGKGKIVRTTPAAQPPPPTPHWHSVSPDLLRAIRADGFLVEQGDDGGYAVRVTPSHPHDLLRIRLREDGIWDALAIPNSEVRRTYAFNLAARKAVARIDAALLQTSLERENVHVLKALRLSHVSLLSAEKVCAPSSRRRHLRTKVAQGGLPGLGKRRQRDRRLWRTSGFTDELTMRAAAVLPSVAPQERRGSEPGWSGRWEETPRGCRRSR